jgi:hexokinase
VSSPHNTTGSCALNIFSSEEGLQKVGSTMSQIPTYVTAVPNGTEKASLIALYED